MVREIHPLLPIDSMEGKKKAQMAAKLTLSYIKVYTN